ncbi:MAG: nicotinate-nucleotide diphosphorylase [Planctomycetota bacterium]
MNSKNSINPINYLIELALKEDIGKGDITTHALIPKNQKSTAVITAKENGIVAGLPLIKLIYQSRKLSGRNIKVTLKVKEGSAVKEGSIIAVITGPTRDILSGERTVLNFLQRLSGIATLTNQFIKKVAGYKVKILDTRKTVPGWRILDKYAVKMGGGFNHRFGLDDAFLIKGNHLKTLSIWESLQKIQNLSKRIKRIPQIQQINPPYRLNPLTKSIPVEIEVRNLDEFTMALIFLTDKAVSKPIIMLDNMTPKEIKEAVKIRNKTNPEGIRDGKGKSFLTHNKIMLEASGGITLNNIKQFASTGVDYISIGMLTHSPKALDISLQIKH